MVATPGRAEGEASVVASSDNTGGAGDSDPGGGDGPAIIFPEKWHACRLVRGRRYRPGISGGMRREIYKKNLVILRSLRSTLAETDPPVDSSAPSWTAAIYSSVYLATAFALAVTFGIALASAVELVALSWIAVTLPLRLVAATFVTTTASTAGASAMMRYRRARLVSGRRLACCRRTRRRHGRRSASSGYLKKVSRNAGTSRSGGHGFATLRGGGRPKRNAPAPNRGVATSAAGRVKNDHAYWCGWVDTLWRNWKDGIEGWGEAYFNKEMERTEDERNEARDVHEATMVHADWLEAMDLWKSNLEEGETWWDQEHYDVEMERTKELRDAAEEGEHKQAEADEREEEAAADGDKQACSGCGQLGGSADDVPDGDVSFLAPFRKL